jgi:hypothetical protein
MQIDHPYWSKWVLFLQRWGLGKMAAFFLDAGGPIRILAAQAIYIGQPFLHQAVSAEHLEALANLLEDQELAKEFAAVLREENSL